MSSHLHDYWSIPENNLHSLGSFIGTDVRVKDNKRGEV